MFPHVSGILRTYNNNQNVLDSIVRAMKNGLGFLYVVVNGEKEEGRGTVASKIESDPRLVEYRSKIRVIEMTRGYSWSPAINVALREINAMRTISRMKGGRGTLYVLCLSTEVEWRPDHLKEMSKAFVDPYVGVVGTTFHARDDHGRVDLGVTYCHPRNTFALWRADSLAEAGDFDPVCDTLGGQEDFEMIVRMGLFIDRGYVMVDDAGEEPVRLSVGQNYDQKSKEERELASTRSIVELWRRRTAHNADAAEMLNHILEDKFSFIPL